MAGKGAESGRTRDVALISVFAALWIAAEVGIGRFAGSFSVGPFSSHGIINRLVGWLLMTTLAEITHRVGTVATMSAVSALVTRMFRRETFEGIVVGLGYAVAGVVFDALYAALVRNRGGRTRRIAVLTIGIVSSVVASVPYVASKLWLLGFEPFVVWFATVGGILLVKNVTLSIAGTVMGLAISPRILVLLRR